MKRFFNLYQANIFIKHGATVLGCGWSRSKGYVEFKVDDIFKELQEKWDTHTLEK